MSRQGFNAATLSFGDLVADGVVDPAWGQQRDDILRSLEEPIPDAVQAQQQVVR